MRSYKNNFPYSSYAIAKLIHPEWLVSPPMTCSSNPVPSSPKLPEQQAHVPRNVTTWTNQLQGLDKMKFVTSSIQLNVQDT